MQPYIRNMRHRRRLHEVKPIQSISGARFIDVGTCVRYNNERSFACHHAQREDIGRRMVALERMQISSLDF